MNVCFQNHIEEKQYSETTLLATHNDRNRRNTLKQTNNILRLSAGHPLPLPIARLLGTRFRFDFFQQTSRLLGMLFFVLISQNPNLRISGTACFWMFLVYLYNVLLKPRLNQDSCKTFRIICLLCLLQGSQDIRKTSLKSKKHFSAAITICTFLKGMLLVYEFALSETHHFLTGIL